MVKIKAEYQENKLPVTDDSQLLLKLCAKLEYLLQNNFKGDLVYWIVVQYLCKKKGIF